MNIIRNGRFTSSGVVALTKEPTEAKKRDGVIFGAPALTYIEEKQFERNLKRSLETVTGRECWWGKVAELKAFRNLDTSYSISSDITQVHPNYSEWCGTPDGFKHEDELTVFDIKCPFTLKSFCTFAKCKTIEEVRENHKDGEKYYWQLVSNACIFGVDYAELIIYCPYKDELDEIREIASNYDGDLNKVAWINFSQDEDLPHLIREGNYLDMYKFAFKVPEVDKLYIESRIKEATKMLLS